MQCCKLPFSFERSGGLSLSWLLAVYPFSPSFSHRLYQLILSLVLQTPTKMTNRNWKQNFKRKKKHQYGKNRKKNSITYQRQATTNSDVRPDNQAAQDDIRANPYPLPNALLFIGAPGTVPRDALSKEPPAPLFLVDAHPLWNAYSCVRVANPLSPRLALYRASRLYVKYVLDAPGPPPDYCVALEEVRFLETLQEIEILQQSGGCISEQKRHQLLEIWEKDLLPVKESTHVPQDTTDSPSHAITAQVSPPSKKSFTNISPSANSGSTTSYAIKKRDRAFEINQARLEAAERKLVKALAAKEKASSLLDKVRSDRNKQRDKIVIAEELLKITKSKNKDLTKQLKTETIKSTETNHRAWLNNKANLTLLEETENLHQDQLKKQQEEAEQQLQNERRSLQANKKANLTLLNETNRSHKAELKNKQEEAKQQLQKERRSLQDKLLVQEKKLSAERLLRSYLKRKYEKRMEKECNYLEAKIAAKTGELDMSHQHVLKLKTRQ